MAKIRNGILGKAKGKIGGVVASTWKGVNYVREYVVPANPKTAAQTGVRTNFSSVVAIGRSIKTDIIDTYWKDLVKGKPNSGWAKYIGVNQKRITAARSLTAFALATGDLESFNAGPITYNYSAHTFNMSWIDNPTTTGQSTDELLFYVWDPLKKYLYSYTPIPTRATEDVEFLIPGLADGQTVYCFYVPRSTVGLYGFGVSQAVTIQE